MSYLRFKKPSLRKINDAKQFEVLKMKHFSETDEI